MKVILPCHEVLNRGNPIPMNLTCGLTMQSFVLSHCVKVPPLQAGFMQVGK